MPKPVSLILMGTVAALVISQVVGLGNVLGSVPVGETPIFNMTWSGRSPSFPILKSDLQNAAQQTGPNFPKKDRFDYALDEKGARISGWVWPLDGSVPLMVYISNDSATLATTYPNVYRPDVVRVKGYKRAYWSGFSMDASAFDCVGSVSFVFSDMTMATVPIEPSCR